MTDLASSSVPYRTIRDLTGDERPRERLLRHGAATLSDVEILAILLGSGVVGESVIDVSRRLLDTFGGLPGLARADATLLGGVRGLGPARIAHLAAAVELGNRVQQTDPDSRPSLATPEAVAALLAPRLATYSREAFFALSLDSRGRLIGSIAPLASGSVNAVTLRPAEVFRDAVILNAVSLILVHNHPSGDPAPSPQDVAVTRELIAAGRQLDIVVLDHVILAGGTFLSLNREGYAFRSHRA